MNVVQGVWSKCPFLCAVIDLAAEVLVSEQKATIHRYWNYSQFQVWWQPTGLDRRNIGSNDLSRRVLFGKVTILVVRKVLMFLIADYLQSYIAQTPIQVLILPISFRS